jgi:hypothetical protein
MHGMLSQVYSCNLVVENGSGSQVIEARFFESVLL